jgi:hypothetical protein
MVAASANSTSLAFVNEKKLIVAVLLKQIPVAIASSSVNHTYCTS